jgi:predicted dehydrogenase
VLGVIGAGGFAKAILVPALVKTSARLRTICDAKGTPASYLARKFGAERAVSEVEAVLEDPSITAVLIATGHDSHAHLVCRALAAGKHVFVEKPLALNHEQLDEVVRAAKAHPDRQLMVGYNRRFSAHTVQLKRLLEGRAEPLAMSMTVNGGMIPPDHWVQDPARGGGRIIGEACHFIDLMVHLAGSLVESVAAFDMGEGPAVRGDKMVMSLRFADGSIGTINYFSNGSKAYPKETLEVFSDGRVARLENFRKLVGYGFKDFRGTATLKQDKGHVAEVAEFVDNVSQGGAPVIRPEELANVSAASLALVQASVERRMVAVASDHEASRARNGIG